MGAGSCKDLVWSKELLGKFLRRSGRTEELCLDKGLTTNWEFGSLSSSGISRNLVATLTVSYMLPELLVKLIKVSDKVTCASGREVTLGMNSNVRVVALVGKEGRNTGRSTGHVVVSELGKW